MDQLSPTAEKYMHVAVAVDGDDDSEVESLDGSDDTLSSVAHFTKEEEWNVLRKLDLRVVGLVSCLYLLSFLDRSNIGNAKIAGMMSDLHMTGDQYEWLLTSFYITYISFQFLILSIQIIPPRIFLSLIVLSWGIIASSQALVQSFPALVTARALLGLTEAAFAGPFYLSLFYRREELAFRTGIFISAAPLATSFASSLAALIAWVAEKSNGAIAPWRLLFLAEGLPNVLVAVYCWSHLANGPGTAWFLTSREMEVATARLSDEKNGTSSSSAFEVEVSNSKGIRLSEILETFKDVKSYLIAAIFFSANVAFASMPVFLPTIVKEMGYTSISAQALSAPPYLISFITVIVVAYYSDKRQSRSYFIIAMAFVGFLGYSAILLASLFELPYWVRYMGLYPACMGFFSCVTLLITWMLNNQDSSTKRGAGMAILQFFGQCGPLVGTRLFPAQDSPLYIKGMAVCAAFMALVAVLALCLRRRLAGENDRRTRLAGCGRSRVKVGAGEEGEDAKPLVGGGRQKGDLFLFIL